MTPALPDVSAAARRILVATGLTVLAAAWLGPLPGLASRYFIAHMGMHVAVVAIAAPLVALGLGGSRMDPAWRWPGLFHPLPASAIELAVIWAWHSPALHHLSRHDARFLAFEQGAFLVVALLLWLSAFGGDPRLRAQRTAAGIGGLLMTSMHMTLLGVLLALAPRTLYGHVHGDGAGGLDDQQWGGVLMLIGGGTSYLAGGLYLLFRLLDPPQGAVAPRTAGRSP